MRALLLIAVLAAACDSGTKVSSSGGSAAVPAPKLDVPKVPPSPALVAVPATPRVSVMHDGIEVNGKKVTTLGEGVVPVEDKKDGKHGYAITSLGAAVAPLPKDAPLVVAFDRKLSYRLLLEVLYTAKQKDVGFKNFLFAVTDGKTELAVPFDLPTRLPASHTAVIEREPGDFVKQPSARIKTEVSPTGESSLTSEAVMHKIQSLYQSGLKRCYRDALKRHPKLGGTVALSFTVDKTGKVTKPRAKGFDADIDACMTGAMSRWTFPIPKDKDGAPTDATFTTKLVLVADDGEPAKDKTDKTLDEKTAEIYKELTKRDIAQLGTFAGEERGVVVTQPLLVDPDKMSPKIVVSIAKDKLILWSITGLEGTLNEPRATLPLADPDAMTKLNAQLLDIVKRRWEGKERLPETREIVVMADGTMSLQTVAEVFVAVRSSPDGKTVLFPDILLASGFE